MYPNPNSTAAAAAELRLGARLVGELGTYMRMEQMDRGSTGTAYMCGTTWGLGSERQSSDVPKGLLSWEAAPGDPPVTAACRIECRNKGMPHQPFHLHKKTAY